MNVMIAGGGTGGHLFPGIAVAQELMAQDSTNKVFFVGTERGIETRAVPKAGFELELLPVSALRRVGFFGLLKGAAKLPWSMIEAWRMVKRRRPDVAVSVGGYAAGPAVLAARLRRVPCVVMEQNAIPGFTNRVLSKLVQRVFASLPLASIDARKVEITGNPVRADLLPIGLSVYSIESPLKVLVFGGSQGARALNEIVPEALGRVNERFPLSVVHQAGKNDADKVEARYDAAKLENVSVETFIDDMAQAYRNAHLVICRAGATTLAELTVCGRPSLLVPFPFAVDDHQSKNAEALASVGAARHLAQSTLTTDSLCAEIIELIEAPKKLVAMAEAAKIAGKPGAAKAIVAGLRRLCGEEVA